MDGGINGDGMVVNIRYGGTKYQEIKSMMSNVNKFTPLRMRTKRSSPCCLFNKNNSDGQVSLASWQAASDKWYGIHSFIHTNHSVRHTIRRKKKIIVIHNRTNNKHRVEQTR